MSAKRTFFMKDIEKRIREIVAEISAITEFAEGSIAANSKQYTLKNGTVRRASPQYRFKSRGARGKQVSKYVPPAAAERRKALPHLDESLAKAVSEDMSAYMGEVVSSVAFRSNAPKVHGIRERQVLTRFGWCSVRHPYRVGNPEKSVKDVRRCSEAQLKVPENGRHVPRTLVAMADGTNAPCATPPLSRSSRTTSCTRAAT